MPSYTPRVTITIDPIYLNTYSGINSKADARKSKPRLHLAIEYGFLIYAQFEYSVCELRISFVYVISAISFNTDPL